MTLDDLITLTLEYLDDPNGRRYQPPLITSLINAGMDDVKRIVEDVDETFFSNQKTESVSSSDDVLEFTLEPDVSKIIHVENTSQSPPLPGVQVNYQTRHPTFDSRFIPAGFAPPPEWYIRGNKIGIVNPSSSFTLRYTYSKVLPRLSSKSDTPEVPADYHDLIALQAAKRGFAIEQRDFPKDLEQIRQEQQKQLLTFVESRTRQGPGFVQVMD